MRVKSVLWAVSVVLWASGPPAQTQQTTPDLDTAYEEGRTITADQGPVEIQGAAGLAVEGPLDCGTPGEVTGSLTISSPDAPWPVLEILDTINGAGLTFFSDAGLFQGGLFSDPSTGGGLTLDLGRNDLAPGIFVDGNFAGTESTRLDIHGPERSITLDTSVGGDASVVLPDGAISAEEILDEAGVASAGTGNSTVNLVGGLQILLSRSLTAPSDGHVLLMGTAQATFTHDENVSTVCEFAVTDSPGDSLERQEADLVHATGGTDQATNDYPITTHALIPVSAGSHLFYFTGYKATGGTVTMSDLQLTLAFVPTTYGTIGSLSDNPAEELEASQERPEGPPIVGSQPSLRRDLVDTRNPTTQDTRRPLR